MIIMHHWFDCPLQKYGSILTGDFPETIKHTITDSLGLKGKQLVFQIPHHGSKYNYNNEFLTMSPWHIVSAGRRSRFRHPHKEVCDKYNRRCPLIVVTEDMRSLVKWRIEEKSSSRVKKLNADIEIAATMRWCKENGATATFRIHEINQLPY